MAKTNNLNLELTESDQLLFKEWRKNINGNNTEDEKSNAQIIDEFAGSFSGGETSQYMRKKSATNFDYLWETPDDTPTLNSDKLLSSKGAYNAISATDNGQKIVLNQSGSVAQELKPDKFYDFTGEITALSITLADEVSERENEYKGQFSTGTTAPTVTFPSSITWIGGAFPNIEANKKYQFSILGGIGVMVGV